MRDKADDQHVERAHAAMHEHLVDDHLEEQRRDEGEELQEERGDQHFAEKAAILVDRAEEPADIETAGEIDQAGAPRHQERWPSQIASNSARVIASGRGDSGR